MKKIMIVTLIVILMFTMTTTAFASENMESKNLEIANRVAEKVENILDEDNAIVKNIIDNDFVTFPDFGDGQVALKILGEEKVYVSLPENISYKKKYLANDGTAVYNATLENCFATLQRVEQNCDGMIFDEFRNSVVLNNKNVPTEYRYRYTLPIGYSLISVEEYLTKYATEEEKAELKDVKNAVFILNQQNEIILTVDGLSAIDSDGKIQNTKYYVENNEIVQTIDIDTDAEFPIVLYNTSHPDYQKERYLDEAGIKAVRDSYTGSTFSILIGGVLGIGTAALPTIAGVTLTLISTISGIYNHYSYTTWDNFYETVRNSSIYYYLKVTTTYHYHPGQGTYYPKTNSYAYYGKE